MMTMTTPAQWRTGRGTGRPMEGDTHQVSTNQPPPLDAMSLIHDAHPQLKTLTQHLLRWRPHRDDEGTGMMRRGWHPQ
jgi:hypothetical protein